MSRIVHARIDPDTEKLLATLERRLGWSDSRIVREGIKALEAILTPGRCQIIGMGQFCSGLTDLGSNKRHLRGFGR